MHFKILLTSLILHDFCIALNFDHQNVINSSSRTADVYKHVPALRRRQWFPHIDFTMASRPRILAATQVCLETHFNIFKLIFFSVQENNTICDRLTSGQSSFALPLLYLFVWLSWEKSVYNGICSAEKEQQRLWGSVVTVKTTSVFFD